MYELKDISVIIPTYNRPESLEVTLKSLTEFSKEFIEIIIIDQSKNNLTKEEVRRSKIKKIRYFHLKTPSIPAARNFGLKKCSRKAKLIFFVDDDVTLGKNYFKKILEVFNEFENAKAVGAYSRRSIKDMKWNLIENFIRKIFFLEYFEKDRMRVVSAYGNTYPLCLNRVINSQWIPGVNMMYKKDVFKEIQFDDNFEGYALAEDLDFTYRLFKKYPNSLFITPFASFMHKCASEIKYPDEGRMYMIQINHFYFNYKNLNKKPTQKLIFMWSLFGILIFRILQFLSGFRKYNWLKLKFFLKSLAYCIKNLNKIKSGKLAI